METIKLKDGRIVSKEDYVAAKTKDLIEFGYATIDEGVVANKLQNAINGNPMTIIGELIRADLDIPNL